MDYNKPLIGALFGALSTLPYELITRLLVAIGIGKYSAYQLTSLMITLNRPVPVLGFVISCVLGGVFSNILYYFLSKNGWDFLVTKSIAFSLLIWISLEMLFTVVIEGPRLIPHRPIMDYYIHLTGSICYGLTLGLLYKRYLATTKN